MRTDLIDFSFINVDQFKNYNFLDQEQSGNLIKHICNGIPEIYSQDKYGSVILNTYIDLKKVSYQQFVNSYELQKELRNHIYYTSFNPLYEQFISKDTYKDMQKSMSFYINFSHTFYNYKDLYNMYLEIKLTLPSAIFGYVIIHPIYQKYNIYKIYKDHYGNIGFILFYKDDESNEFKITSIDQNEIGKNKSFFNKKTTTNLLNKFNKQFKKLDSLFIS